MPKSKNTDTDTGQVEAADAATVETVDATDAQRAEVERKDPAVEETASQDAAVRTAAEDAERQNRESAAVGSPLMPVPEKLPASVESASQDAAVGPNAPPNAPADVVRAAELQAMDRVPGAAERIRNDTVAETADPAEREGYLAYEDGKSESDNPFSANSPDGIRWIAGMGKAQQAAHESRLKASS